MAPQRLAAPRVRLICFAHAGAGASVFQPWAAPWAGQGVELRAVQYPGRESRWGEPLITSAGRMADSLVNAWPELRGNDGVPVVFYGHSMGVLIALELARRLAGDAQLQHVVMAARNPPHTARLYPPIHHLTDDAFLDAVAARYGNLPAALLADREMRELITPVLKADFQLVDEYSNDRKAMPLSVPFTVLAGERDPFTAPEAMGEWDRYTTADCTVQVLPAAGHFFHQEAREATWATLAPVLDRIGR